MECEQHGGWELTFHSGESLRAVTLRADGGLHKYHLKSRSSLSSRILLPIEISRDRELNCYLIVGDTSTV